jgi:DNA-binding NtrC family response regulator
MFITGDTLAPRTMKFLQSGKLTYLAKPFLVEELKLAVNRRLGDLERYPDKSAVKPRTKQSAMSRRT